MLKIDVSKVVVKVTDDPVVTTGRVDHLLAPGAQGTKADFRKYLDTATQGRIDDKVFQNSMLTLIEKGELVVDGRSGQETVFCRRKLLPGGTRYEVSCKEAEQIWENHK